MRWADERYTRVYTRDTTDWLALSFDAQALLLMLLRKCDRAGLIELGRQGKRAVAVVIGHASEWKRLEPAFEELLVDGCIVLHGTAMIFRNFIAAQEAPQSDKSRKAAQRERDRDIALSQNVTERHEPSQPVTPGHVASLRAVPDRAVPDRTVPTPAGKPRTGRKNVGSKGSEPHPDHDRFVKIFSELFSAANDGAKATWNGHTCRIAKELLQAHGFDELTRRAGIMLTLPANTFPKAPRDLGTLKQFIDRFASTSPGGYGKPSAPTVFTKTGDREIV